MKFGLKIWSENDSVSVNDVKKLYVDGLFDFIELFVVPGSFKKAAEAWSGLDVPYYLHAPHSYAGLNMSLRQNEEKNRALIGEVELFRKTLRPRGIVFHSGIKGTVEETIRQILLYKSSYAELFDCALIENKPKIGLNGELCIGASPTEIKEIVSNTNMGFCLDVGHAAYYAAWAGLSCKDVINDFLAIEPCLFHLSDGDVKSCSDMHLNFGEGNFELEWIMRRITSESSVTIETKRSPSGNFESYKKDVNFLRNICNDDLKLRHIRSDDEEDLFLWRNDPEVRKNSFSTGVVTSEEHALWFAKKNKDPNVVMYLAHAGKNKIGVIRFEDKGNEIVVNVMLNPNFVGMGFGSKLIKLGTEIFVGEKRPDRPIVAEVKKDNVASLKAFEKAGYSEKHRVYLYGAPKDQEGVCV